MKRYFIVTLLLLLATIVVACAQAEPTLVPTATPIATPTPEPTPTFIPTPPSMATATLTAEGIFLSRTLDKIAIDVVQMRDLEPLQEVDRNFMTREELSAFFVEELEEDREDISRGQELLAILNLIPSYMDLYRLYLDLLGEQVAGLYDTEEEKLYVIGNAEDFGPSEEVTFAHEYVHALQQQHFDIHALAESLEDDSEASAALSALIEGDASILQLQYMFSSLSQEGLGELFQAGEDSPVLDQAPYTVQQLLFYPYDEGVAFVTALLDTGRLDAVNQAYSNPPVSTEQILHPEKYFENEKPMSVSLPDLETTLGPGWSQIDSDVAGEFLLRTYLETGSERTIAAAAAAGWGGDRYILLRGPQNERMLVLIIIWDAEEDAREFFDVALAPLEGSPNKQFVGIYEDRTLLIVAPTEAHIEAVRLQIPIFSLRIF